MTLSFLLSLALILSPLPQVRIPGPGGAGAAAGVTWTLIQHPSNFTCNPGGAGSSGTCTLSGFTATGANHLLILVSSAYDAPIAGSGASFSVVGNNGSDTALTHCAAAGATFQYISQNWVSSDCSYILNSAGGTTSFTATWNWGGSLGGSPSWFIDLELIEVARSTGSATFDTSNSSTNASCNPCTAPTLSISGSSDYIAQWAAIGQSDATSISGAYSNPFDNDTSLAAAFSGALNQSSGTGPSWTMGATAKLTMSGVAFK